MMKAFRRTMGEPSVIAAIVCYFLVIAAIVVTANTAQDRTRQRQIDHAVKLLKAHIDLDTQRVIDSLP